MLLIALGFLFILLVDLPPLIRRKAWVGVAGFLLVFVPALTLAVMLNLGVKIPSSLLLLGQLFKSVGLTY